MVRKQEVTVAAAVLVVVVGAWLRTGNGQEWRIPVDRQHLGPAAWFEMEQAYCRQRNPALPYNLITCQNNRGRSDSIILWGDSHARHWIAGFSEVYSDFNVYVIDRSGCLSANGFLGYEGDDRVAEAACINQNRRALPFLRQMPNATVVLSNSKRDTPDLVAPPTAWLASQLREAGHQVIILGDVIIPGRLLVSCRTVPSWLIPDSTLA